MSDMWTQDMLDYHRAYYRGRRLLMKTPWFNELQESEILASIDGEDNTRRHECDYTDERSYGGTTS